MEPRSLLPLLILGLALASAQLDDETKKKFLDKHNELRNRVKNFPDRDGNLPAARPKNMRKLLWDADLAGTAQQVAEMCVWGHPDKTWPEALRVQYLHRSGGIGENLARLSSPEDMVEKTALNWVMKEMELFSWGENRCYAGDGESCWHMTQVMWADTEFLGCGAADCGDWTSVVCHYMKQGNLNGRAPFEVLGEGEKMCSLPGYSRDCDYPNLCSAGCQPREVGECLDKETNNHCFLLAVTRDWCETSQINNGIRDCAKTCRYCQTMTCEEFGFETLPGAENKCFRYFNDTTSRRLQGHRTCRDMLGGRLWTPLLKRAYNDVMDVVKERTEGDTGVWLGYRRDQFLVQEGMTYRQVKGDRLNPANFRDPDTRQRMTWMFWNFRPGQPDDLERDGEGEACIARASLTGWDKVGVDDVRCDSKYHVLCEFDIDALALAHDVPCENDFTDDRCWNMIEREADVCETDSHFAYMRCPKACRKCSEIQSNLAQYRERLVDMDLGPYKAPNEGILPGTTNCGCT